MKTLIVIDRNKGILYQQKNVLFTDTLKNTIEKEFILSMTFFGICWIEYQNFIIYTNCSNWQMFTY